MPAWPMTSIVFAISKCWNRKPGNENDDGETSDGIGGRDGIRGIELCDFDLHHL